MAMGHPSLHCCDLTSLPPLPLLGRHGRARSRSPCPSALRCSSLPAGDGFGEEVLRAFITERQLRGDFVSKVSDIVWRRNSLDLDVVQVSAAQEHGAQPEHAKVGEDCMSDGFLRLAATSGRVSGGSSPAFRRRVSDEERQNERDKTRKLNLLRYEALKGELLLLTTGIGAACTVYCLLIFSPQAAVSYAIGVAFSCLYLQLLYRHADDVSRECVPEIFLKKKAKKIGIRSEDLKNTIEKTLGGTAVALSSPRLVIPAVVFGLWALSDHFRNDIFNFQLVPGMMGFFAYKAAALVQVYRDNEDLLMIFPDDNDNVDSS